MAGRVAHPPRSALDWSSLSSEAIHATILDRPVRLAFALPAQATVIEVPLPELLVTLTTGNSDNYKRTVVVQLPAVPSVIRRVSMRMRGVATQNAVDCRDAQYVVPMDLNTSLFEVQPFTLPYVDFDSHPIGQFSFTRNFEHYPVSDYSFMLDGTANLQIGAYGPGIYRVRYGRAVGHGPVR
jgi:hypothetical protein